MSDDHTFSANKIFGFLILYTALEVVWGTAFDFPRWAIWSGLLIFAFLKGYLIFTWFMHMKFEQPILKFMVVPTIPLIAILIFANMPDTSFNDDMLYPIGHQLEVEMRLFDPESAYDEVKNPYVVRGKSGEVTGMPDVTAQKTVRASEAHDPLAGGH
jgi:caa(3)-type oxidase subunit IV